MAIVSPVCLRKHSNEVQPEMNRRELIKLGSVVAVAAPFLQIGCGVREDNVRRLFYDPLDIERIRAAAQSPRLAGTLSDWANADPTVIRTTIERPLVTGDLLSHLSTSMTTIFQQCIVHLVSGSQQSEAHIIRGLEVLDELPVWDYMRDGDEKSNGDESKGEEGKGDVLGLMRASKASGCTLLCMQVLGDKIDPARRTALLKGVADKGCEPCHRTLMHMDNPGTEKGWGVQADYRERVDVDMSNWPTILGNNNLRAIPTMGLGLGALALVGIDSRAEQWLEKSVASSKTFLALLDEDGSYFEGISYIDFAFRSLFPFFDAYDRLRGDVDWNQFANFHGVCEYIAVLQNGVREDGRPDIINLSDARDSVFTCVPAWIAQRNGDSLAQYAAQHFAQPGFYADFFWYDPDAPSSRPDDSLLNAQLDLDWVVCRTGWGGDDTVVGLRSGPPTNHEHADRNSIQIKSRGERLLTDPFGASYNPQDAHWLLRLTAAHNAVLINGQGHQYHNGEQGTSEGLAKAEIINFTDDGEIVHFTSDATHGYNLVNPAITKVVRSVLFIKPDVVVLIDQIASDRAVEIAIHFHPDNRDEQAKLDVKAYEHFTLSRPNAKLSCTYMSDVPVRARATQLDLPQDVGRFPFVELLSARSADATVVTAMKISGAESLPAGDKEIKSEHPLLQREFDGAWRVTVPGATARIHVDDRVPTIQVERIA